MWLHRANNPCDADKTENKSIISQTKKNYVYNEITHKISSYFL